MRDMSPPKRAFAIVAIVVVLALQAFVVFNVGQRILAGVLFPQHWVAVGECVNAVSAELYASIEKVPCDGPHKYTVVAVTEDSCPPGAKTWPDVEDRFPIGSRSINYCLKAI